MSENKQELSKEFLEKLDKMKQEIVEEMVRRGWDRKKAQDQADAFS
jgi:hypothetical protein